MNNSNATRLKHTGIRGRLSFLVISISALVGATFVEIRAMVAK
jgi:hypothetical protein